MIAKPLLLLTVAAVQQPELQVVALIESLPLHYY